MISLQESEAELSALREHIRTLLPLLGSGKIDSVAYDTGWVARLPSDYLGPSVEKSLEWLRHHQHEDGSWGADILHNHDRFISTLSAVVALREAGHDEQDGLRVQKGVDALWHYFSCLDQDASDTIGFPILSVSLMGEAQQLGLNVPKAPIRYAAAYEKRIIGVLGQSQPHWRNTPLAFSLEGLRVCIPDRIDFLESNGSVGTSPAATSALLLSHHNESALAYLHQVMEFQGDGGMPAIFPIDTFEAIWSINSLRVVGAIHPDEPAVRRVLNLLWQFWETNRGYGTSSYFSVPDLDDTAGNFSVLQWGGYPVQPDMFANYEMDEHFCCFRGETNPSISAHLRLLLALRPLEDYIHYDRWVQKIVNILSVLDRENPTWWDKWHASPYYVSGMAVRALYGIADDLLQGRIKWILETQNIDGGWGHYGSSTPEETAYSLEALLFVDRNIQPVAKAKIKAAAMYLDSHVEDNTYSPLWIGKSLYTPHYVVKAAILAALYAYQTHGDK